MNMYAASGRGHSQMIMHAAFGSGHRQMKMVLQDEKAKEITRWRNFSDMNRLRSATGDVRLSGTSVLPSMKEKSAGSWEKADLVSPH